MIDETPKGDLEPKLEKTEIVFQKEGKGEADFNDRLIVSQIAAGQKDLFRLLVRRHEKAVYGMGMSFFRNHEDASDFTQEVFLKVFRSLSRFEGRSRFSTWLYKIAYNTALNEVNRKKEYQSLAEEDTEKLVNNNDTPERTVLRNAASTAVRAAIEELPERFRICIDLFFFYDRSYQEIEAITGIPVNTIKSHVFRAKILLKEKLESFVEN
ncbi:MAG: sigma-70 family RNA polymerase sigma factor [Treponema sp.]|nr:sigma-70 family RNA polymerase sigma factor [Treponema sp.]MCL2250966.1 sigma-70 family RNA polymerase sigma factor [Treponema sp.]